MCYLNNEYLNIYDTIVSAKTLFFMLPPLRGGSSSSDTILSIFYIGTRIIYYNELHRWFTTIKSIF